MKTKKLLSLVGLLILIILICNDSLAQGSLAITVDQSNRRPISIPCGGYYTSLLAHVDFNNGISVKEDTWTITNVGNESLTIQLPLTFSAGSSPNLSITSQPQSILRPGDVTTFTTSYVYSFGSNDLGFIDIDTGGSPDDNCGFLLRGMIETVSLCQCYCSDNNELVEVCTFELDGFLGGISIDDNICESDPEDISCNSIQLVTECDCSNTINTETLSLFADTMRITGLPGTNILLSDNVDSDQHSFLNRNGAPFRRGSFLGQINTSGYVDIPMFRRPETSINIMLNGVKFTSNTSCPLIEDCPDDGGDAVIPAGNMETIPTLSEWSIFLLGIILTIIGLVALRSPIIDGATVKN